MVNETFNIGFQGKNTNEVYQFHYYRHWIKWVQPFALLCTWTAIIIAAYFMVFDVPAIDDDGIRRGMTMLCVLALWLTHFWFMFTFYKRFLYVVIVTDKRVHRIRKKLLIVDDHQSIDLRALQDIKKAKHGLVPNVCNYGKLTLEAQETVLELHHVPHISHVYHKMLDVHEKARSRHQKQ